MVASGSGLACAFISIDTIVLWGPSYLALAPCIEFWCILQVEAASNWGENTAWEFLAARSAYVTTYTPALRRRANAQTNCSESFEKKPCTTGRLRNVIASFFTSDTWNRSTGIYWRSAHLDCAPSTNPSTNCLRSESIRSAGVCRPISHWIGRRMKKLRFTTG